MTPQLTPQELGIHGEKVAEKHLMSLGYRILNRNWRWRKGEMDLIMEQDGSVIRLEHIVSAVEG